MTVAVACVRSQYAGGYGTGYGGGYGGGYGAGAAAGGLGGGYGAGGAAAGSLGGGYGAGGAVAGGLGGATGVGIGYGYGGHAQTSSYSTVQHHPAPAPHPVVLAAPPSATSSLSYGAAVNTAGHAAPHYEPYDPHPHYTFSYDVNDYHTGDSKAQHETRTGDVVHGAYSVSDPDGVRRTVTYSADPHTGFHAEVRRHGYHAAGAAAGN